ncbi:hypothetical protein EDD17DRAFT_531866 [Pisolithus thermaeus]|nr:hypothetical protein EDD17DRAFT_531866 [Pisolithus thermaeus]
MEEQHKLTSPVNSTNGDRRQLGGVWKRLAASIFLVFLGGLSFEELQHIAEKADKKEWNELKKDLTDRTNNINVVAALVVASSAEFLTTPAPTERLYWYNIKFPYFCMQLGFGCAVLAVVSGLSKVVFLSMMGPTDIQVSVTLSYSILLLTPIALPTTINPRGHGTGCSHACSFSCQ